VSIAIDPGDSRIILAGSTRQSRLVAAVATGTLAVLATPAGAEPRPAQAAATPVERTVELMEALKAHRNAACDLYDPLFFELVGFAARDCERVLRKTFPRSERVAYRVDFGGRIGPRLAVVIASMALGGSALACEVAWQGARHCPSASAFYLELTLKTLLVDWRGRRMAAPQSPWYLTSVGDV
jgi:hypothetical protein